MGDAGEVAGAMPQADGATLRAWRRSRGWDVPETAARLRSAAAGTGQAVAVHDALIRMIYGWERGDHRITERYELLYARALGTAPDDLAAGVAAPAGPSGPTLLGVLVRERHWRVFRTFEAQFARAARELAEREEEPGLEKVTVSERTFERWYSGNVRTMPRSDAARVLEHMFGFPAQQLLGPPSDPTPAHASDQGSQADSVIIEVGMRATPRGRERNEPGPGYFAVEHEVVMAAHESSDHAAEHEQHGIGEATLEQLLADLARLSSLSDTGAPLCAFLDMRRVRDRIYRLLDRRLWPGEQADLYFLLGCLHELMGLAANRLGYPEAAEDLLRAGWAYASAIGHNPLRGMLRARLSYVMYWRGRYRESRDLAADGLRYASQGLVGTNLHLEQARALARLGDPDAARREVGLAHAARQAGFSDDLTQIGGEEFALSRAATSSMAGGALAEVGDGREAAGELETAVRLYDAGPGPGERHGVAGKALAGADLAMVRVRAGTLDGAVAALEPVLILPPAQRVATLTTRLTRVRDELAAPVFHGSPQARDLGDQIEEFGREAVIAGLHSLSSPS